MSTWHHESKMHRIFFWWQWTEKLGKMAAFLNGLATNREHLTDDFFTDADQHDPAGTNIMLLGLDVLPEHQHQGLARELMEQYKGKRTG